MSDFAQRGPITTLPSLGVRPLHEMEDQLSEWANKTPTGVVIPCHADDLHSPAFANIVATLSELRYIDEVIVGLDAAGPSDFVAARKLLNTLAQRTCVVWHHGPRLSRVRETLAAHGLDPAAHGKGRNLWYCFGYVRSHARLARVVVHDADIASYDRGFLCRLAYPVLSPELGYRVAKAFYHRQTDGQLGGRLTRLLVGPLLDALGQVLGQNQALEYLKAFRYPLAGEISFDAVLIDDLVIPNNWGIDLAMLFEFRRAVADQFICQVELEGPYDHKHRMFGPASGDGGLVSMAHDVVGTLHQELATQGHVVSADDADAISQAYLVRVVEDVVRYGHVAEINGLHHDGESELNMAHRLSDIVRQTSPDALGGAANPDSPSWAKLEAADPGISRMLAAAVDADQAE